MTARVHRLNLSTGMLSASIALVLMLTKLWALAATGSLSIAASLADSALDLMVSLAGLAAIAYAARPMMTTPLDIPRPRTLSLWASQCSSSPLPQ